MAVSEIVRDSFANWAIFFKYGARTPSGSRSFLALAETKSNKAYGFGAAGRVWFEPKPMSAALAISAVRSEGFWLRFGRKMKAAAKRASRRARATKTARLSHADMAEIAQTRYLNLPTT